MFDTSSFAQGFAIALGMFVCPGPKDVLILRQALYRRPATDLIAVGVLSDAFLIWVGMAGLSAALGREPALQSAALWLGVVLMVFHGLLSARRAAIGHYEIAGFMQDKRVLTRRRSLAALATVSLLNPAAWLDTVLVIGAAGAAKPAVTQLSFATGAIAASASWFVALVIGGRYAGTLAAAPSTWQVLDGIVALAMLGLAAYLAWTLV